MKSLNQKPAKMLCQQQLANIYIFSVNSSASWWKRNFHKKIQLNFRLRTKFRKCLTRLHALNRQEYETFTQKETSGCLCRHKLLCCQLIKIFILFSLHVVEALEFFIHSNISEQPECTYIVTISLHLFRTHPSSRSCILTINFESGK